MKGEMLVEDDSLILKREHRDRLLEMYYKAQQEGTKYAGHTYEDGINAVIELMEGDADIEDVL